MSEMPAQALSVKRAQVEFHKFASLGEPERVFREYAEKNERRCGILKRHLQFIGGLTPFLEIGANAGHTSYMLANEFGADGFASDISADALRFGRALQDVWELQRAPVRLAGDAVNLPFRDGSIRMVLACQMLSQFMSIESVFAEVRRILMPGGIFVFTEEPLLRGMTLKLFRAPLYQTMKPWERRLHDWGLLGFLVSDVIGAAQEEGFGIRQNHTMNLNDWEALIRKHFVDYRSEIYVPERGAAEKWVRRVAGWFDKTGGDRNAALLLGGTLTGICRKAGAAAPETPLTRFETCLRCPDCHSPLSRDDSDSLACACGYRAPNEGGVYNLLPSAERGHLYPGDRDDIIDMASPGHESLLESGWHGVEGVYGNRYRWMGASATARLRKLTERPQRLRIRGFAPPQFLEQGRPSRVKVLVNGRHQGGWTLDRTGLFVLESDLPDAQEYQVEIHASPAWKAPPDVRELTVNIGMVRLVDRD